jgi:hypothetical protein
MVARLIGDQSIPKVRNPDRDDRGAPAMPQIQFTG